MIGLFFSEAILFAVAALGGFAIGLRLRAMAVAAQLKTAADDAARLRAAWSDAQVRRAARAP
jgi:hypothetical protein